MIGDSLSACPMLFEQSKIEPITIGPNFNQWVFSGLDFPVVFDNNLNQQDCVYKLDASLAMNFSACQGWQWHMAQSYFAMNGLKPIQLPCSFPIKFEMCNLTPGIVIAPYSGSDFQGNKFWPLDNWKELVQNFDEPVYLLGSNQNYPNAATNGGKSDTLNWIEGTNITPVFDKPMAYVADLLIKCKMLVSIDTGISHLAHMLGIKHHALLYPGCLDIRWVNNPHARHVQGWPSTISPNEMLQLCKQIPNWKLNEAV
jgi:hypothetical protein